MLPVDLIQSLLLVGLLILNIVVLLRVRSIAHSLEQPVVKKMSPQLKLRPVRLDEEEDRGGRGPREAGHRAPRPERNDRNDRGERPERTDRNERNDRGDRNDRNGRGGDRFRDRNDRGGRPDNRNDRGDRNRTPRSDVFSNDVAEVKPEAKADGGIAPFQGGRRPLAAMQSQNSAPVIENTEAAMDPEATLVGVNDGDMQHGRRTVLKKKPVFVEEPETTTPAV